jgi:hypothetical protein
VQWAKRSGVRLGPQYPLLRFPGNPGIFHGMKSDIVSDINRPDNLGNRLYQYSKGILNWICILLDTVFEQYGISAPTMIYAYKV